VARHEDVLKIHGRFFVRLDPVRRRTSLRAINQFFSGATEKEKGRTQRDGV
jgi:hypothetical protein